MGQRHATFGRVCVMAPCCRDAHEMAHEVAFGVGQVSALSFS